MISEYLDLGDETPIEIELHKTEMGVAGITFWFDSIVSEEDAKNIRPLMARKITSPEKRKETKQIKSRIIKV